MQPPPGYFLCASIVLSPGLHCSGGNKLIDQQKSTTFPRAQPFMVGGADRKQVEYIREMSVRSDGGERNGEEETGRREEMQTWVLMG